ncbi:MAG: glycosyltransferase family 2 protein, partial [Thermodesulfobacteriota bacterium]
VDGMSEDGTREVITGYAQQHPWIKLIENPQRITPVALNIGIQNARGEIIIWMSAHNHYEKDYVSRSVESLQKYGADNVGGVMKTLPREETFTGQAIVASLSHRFGVGNSYFRVMPKEPKWVDTVFGGCYRREVFDRVGLFNEDLVRGQDMEFNLRLKKAGGRTLLVPDIVSYYYARSDMKSFWKHNFANGVWAILPFLYSPIMPVSWRHLVPLIFVTALVGSGLLGFVWIPFIYLFLVILGSYGLANLGASLQIASEKRNLRYVFTMPFVFASLHFGYGLGSLWGVFRVLSSRLFWRRLFRLGVKNGGASRC